MCRRHSYHLNVDAVEYMGIFPPKEFLKTLVLVVKSFVVVSNIQDTSVPGLASIRAGLIERSLKIMWDPNVRGRWQELSINNHREY